jgi:hypothetical protein
MKTIARQIEIGRAVRQIQVTQNVGNPGPLIGSD